MSYGNLIELSVDASELENRLADIDQKLADLGGEDILDEDAVQRLIDAGDFVSRDDLSEYVDESRVDQIVRDLMHSEGDDFVQTVIDNGSYVTEYEVDDKIRDAISDSTPDDGAVRTIVESVTDGRLHRIDERLDALEDRTREYDSELADLSVLAERVAVLEARTSGGGELGQALTFFGLLRQAFAALR